MNDSFLYELRPDPTARFAAELLARLNTQPGRKDQALAFLRTRRGLASALLAVVTLVACAQYVMRSTWHHETDVVGVSIYETEDLLMLDASEWLSHVLEPPTEGSHLPHEHESIAIQDALERLDYEVYLPSWTPEGFKLNDPTHADEHYWDFAFLFSWRSDDAGILLWTRQSEAEVLQEEQVYPGAWEIVEVQGVEVLIVRGAFEMPFDTEAEARAYLEAGAGPVEQRWNPDAHLRLYWRLGDVHYRMETVTGSFVFPWLQDSPLQYVSEQDLLDMAASIIAQAE